MADVGTDHAQLPIVLLRDGIVPKAVALDVAEGPFQNAKKAARGLEDQLSVRLSDGLEGLVPNEVATICICGMGGNTVAAILERGRAVWKTAKRLVLQPQGMQSSVRRLLVGEDWGCVQAEIAEHRGRLFTIEVWEPGRVDRNWTGLDFRWGQRIRDEPPPLYIDWLQNELGDVQLALERMRSSGALGSAEAAEAREEEALILAELKRIG